MREQLQKLIDDELLFINAIPDCDDFIDEKSAREFFVRKLEAILAASLPSVQVKPGWVCKDSQGMCWFASEPVYVESRLQWELMDSLWDDSTTLECERMVTDPWPDKPNGGPECLLEVK